MGSALCCNTSACWSRGVSYVGRSVWFRLFSDQPRFAVRALGLVLCLILVSWLRSNILTGLPWNLYGMSALSWLPLAQSARLWGVHGLSLLILSVAMLPSLSGTKESWQPVIFGFFASCLGWLYEAQHL